MTEALIIDDNRSTADALLQMLGLLQGAGPRGLRFERRTGTAGQFHARPDSPGHHDARASMASRSSASCAANPVWQACRSSSSRWMINPRRGSRAFRGGANGLIIKPATLDVLEENLRRLGVLKASEEHGRPAGGRRTGACPSACGAGRCASRMRRLRFVPA